MATLLSRFIRQYLATFISTEHRSFVERLAAHLESGAVTPAVIQRFNHADSARALPAIDAGQSGTPVIVVRGPSDDRV